MIIGAIDGEGDPPATPHHCRNWERVPGTPIIVAIGGGAAHQPNLLLAKKSYFVVIFVQHLLDWSVEHSLRTTLLEALGAGEEQT